MYQVFYEKEMREITL